MLGLIVNMSYADEGISNNQAESQKDIPSLELLEMLGQFDTKDENWFENEMNTEIKTTVGKDTGETINE